MKKELELISIVVPVYNLEKYIGRCIESIQKQTYQNIEIILVDDGSEDSSLEVCNRYAKEDERICVIAKANGGPSSARNVGIDRAKGEFIANVDGDDVIDKDYISYLYNLIKQNNADMSICGFVSFCRNEDLANIGVEKTEKIYVMNKEEALEAFLYQKYFTTSNWCRLYKSSILKNEKFPEGNCADDVATNYRFIMQANKVVYGTKKMYYYFQRQDSIIHSWLMQREVDCEKSSREMYETVKREYPHLENAAASKFFSANVQILAHISLREIYKENHEYILKNIKKYRKKVLFNRKSRWVNRLCALTSYFGMWILRIGLYIYCQKVR